MKISKMIDFLRILQEEYGDKEVGVITKQSGNDINISALKAEDLVVFEKVQQRFSIHNSKESQ